MTPPPSFFLLCLSFLSLASLVPSCLVPGVSQLRASSASPASPLGVTQLAAPVKDFCLPVFGESGYKAWDLSGSEGHYLGPDCLDVTQMQLRTFSFSGEGILQLEAILQSPSARIDLPKNLASSKASIHIEGPGYTGEGIGWTWDGKTHTLRLKARVRVVFKDTALNPSPSS